MTGGRVLVKIPPFTGLPQTLLPDWLIPCVLRFSAQLLPVEAEGVGVAVRAAGEGVANYFGGE